VSSDGHEKLAHQALAMGDVGLPIYAYKDKWSDTVLKLSVVPNCRTNGAIGHLYLDLIQEIGGKTLVRFQYCQAVPARHFASLLYISFVSPFLFFFCLLASVSSSFLFYLSVLLRT
jgi:hypothetical protein